MKTCIECGGENEDQATRCGTCGADFAPAKSDASPPATQPDPDEGLEKVAGVDNEVQAELIEGVLTERAIPHIMQSYHDSAYDGLFQSQHGWGVILAPPSFRAEILELVDDIKRKGNA